MPKRFQAKAQRQRKDTKKTNKYLHCVSAFPLRLGVKCLRHRFKTLDELLEPLVASQPVKHRLNPNQDESRVTCFECLVQILNRLVVVLESCIDIRKIQPRNVPAL